MKIGYPSGTKKIIVHGSHQRITSTSFVERQTWPMRISMRRILPAIGRSLGSRMGLGWNCRIIG